MVQVASSSIVSRRDGGGRKYQEGVMKEERMRSVTTSGKGESSKIYVSTSASNKISSRTNSQDSYVLPDDIEDPLAGCYSESD